MSFLADLLRGRAARTRRHRHVRPTLEALDGRALLATVVADTGIGGVDVVSGSGYIYHFDSANGATQTGLTTGFVSVVDGHNSLGQDEVFAQTADGSVWVFRYNAPGGGGYPVGQWTNTGGALVLNTVIPTADGITGIAGGGTVFHFQDDGGYSQLGSLSGAIALTYTQPNSPAPELFAQTNSLAIDEYTAGSGQFATTGGAFEPGTMIATGAGIAGIAGGGTVWHYQDGVGYQEVGNLTGTFALADSSGGAGGAEALFAQKGDASIWSGTFGAAGTTGINYGSGQWTNTGGALVLGSMVGTPSGIVGVAGGGTVFQYAGGYSQAGTITGVASVIPATNVYPGLSSDYFAILVNPALWYLNASGQWVNTNISLTPGIKPT